MWFLVFVVDPAISCYNIQIKKKETKSWMIAIWLAGVFGYLAWKASVTLRGLHSSKRDLEDFFLEPRQTTWPLFAPWYGQRAVGSISRHASRSHLPGMMDELTSASVWRKQEQMGAEVQVYLQPLHEDECLQLLYRAAGISLIVTVDRKQVNGT